MATFTNGLVAPARVSTTPPSPAVRPALSARAAATVSPPLSVRAAATLAAGGPAKERLAPRSSLSPPPNRRPSPLSTPLLASRATSSPPKPKARALSPRAAATIPAMLAKPVELDTRAILEMSQTIAEELDRRIREKATLTRLLGDLKKKLFQNDGKLSKKQHEVEQTRQKTIDLKKKLDFLTSSNKMQHAELGGLKTENERMQSEVDELKEKLREATAAFENERLEVEKQRQTLYTYRKDINGEAKQRDQIQADLRASRTAQNLMINRLDAMEKRNRALKTCVVETFSGRVV